MDGDKPRSLSVSSSRILETRLDIAQSWNLAAMDPIDVVLYVHHRKFYQNCWKVKLSQQESACSLLVNSDL